MSAELPDPLLLLRRSERVRALARRLLHGTDGAEDVAQEALLSSLAWRELPDEPLPARLAAQVRSLAWRWRRGRWRRAHREAEVARPDRSESVDELVERAAWQRTLVEAVLELEEPYRECVLLRYFEGLPPRAIAERQDVPVRTVHTRLARALTRLRARLERRVDLSAWVPLLAPLAAPPARPLAIPASSLGVLAVAPSKWTLSLVAGAVVASTLLVLRGTGVFDAPRPLARPVESERPSLQAVASPETAPQGLLVPVAVDTRASAGLPRVEPGGALETPPDRELDLFGEVVDIYGQPLSGATLNALLPVGASDREGCVQPRGSAVLAATTSDGEGRFRMRLERGQECTLEASLPGLAPVHLVERRAGERVQVVLGPAARLSGRVVRASDGSGVEGAVIRLRERRATFVVRAACSATTTDADGSYAFEDLPAGAYDPWVTCPSDPGLSGPVVVLEPGQSLEHEFVVPASLDVRGRVVDADTGAGIDRAEVSLSPFFETSVRTASDGSFLLHGWSPEEMGRSVHARADGRVHGARALPRGAAEAVDFELRLARGAGITGRILGPMGAPQPDARVEVHGSLITPGLGRDRWSVPTDPDGRFELIGLHRDQNYTLVASAPGAGRLVVDLPDFDPERDPRDLGDLDLPVSSSLAGRVVDGNGRPVPGAYVRLFGGDPGRNRLRAPSQEPLAPFVPVITLRLDDLGRFWASDLARGEYTLTADAAGLSSEAQTSVSLGEGEQREGLELVLDLGARIAGRVVGPDGEPVALALIDAVPSDDGPIAHMITRPDGSFELSGLREGLHTLAIEHFPGKRTYCDARVEGVRTGTLDLHIVLPEASSLSGVVLDLDGSPLPEATVQIDHHDGRLGGMSTVLTDSQGQFHLLVPAGAPVDLVAADWRQFFTEGSTDIPQGRVERVDPGATDVVIRIAP